MSKNVVQTDSEVAEKKKSLKAFGPHISLINTPLDEPSFRSEITQGSGSSSTSQNTLHTVQGKFSALSVIIDRDNEVTSFNRSEDPRSRADIEMTEVVDSGAGNVLTSLSDNDFDKLPAIPKKEATDADKVTLWSNCNVDCRMYKIRSLNYIYLQMVFLLYAFCSLFSLNW